MMGQALTDLGWVAYGQSDYIQAASRFEEALRLYGVLGEKYAITAALMDLGRAVQIQNDYRRAAKFLEEALNLAREIGHNSRIVRALLGLGELAWSQANYEGAAQLFEEALIISREDKLTREITFALYCLGRVAQSRVDYASARSFYREALATCRVINDQHHTVPILLGAFADLVTTQFQMERGIQLFGALATVYDQARLFRSPIERIDHDQAIATARAALGEEAFAASWELGKKMTLDEAVENAIENFSV